MYEQIERPKGNVRGSTANSVTQNKSNVKQELGFVDNRPEAIDQRRMKELVHSRCFVKPIRAVSEANTTVQRVPLEDEKELRHYFDRRIMEVGSPTSKASRRLFEDVSQLASLVEAKNMIDDYVAHQQNFIDLEGADEPDGAGGLALTREIATPPVGRLKVPTNVNLHQQLMAVVMDNHRTRPYATDFFHEKKPLMEAIMTNDGMLARIGYFLSALGDVLHVVKGYNIEDRPQIRVIGCEIIINPQLAGFYQRAIENMQTLRGGVSPVHLLAAGHSPSMIDTIAHTGYRPDLGQYHGMKGHGALGRGAYFTDRVDKAISYSGNEPETRGQFLLSNVASGRTLERDSGADLRHETHNEMVREGRSALNRSREEGRSEQDLSGFDSIVGREQHESGGSAVSALVRSRRGEFDSDEWLVRNGDQVLPQFIIHYEVLPAPQRSSRWLSGTLMILGTGAAILGGYLWFRKRG
jgi:hypothetical protein